MAGKMQRIFCAVAVLVAVGLQSTNAYTDPNNYNKLVAFRDSMKVRSPNWAAALDKWTCPTPPANSQPPGACDPCGQLSDGNWYHMHCRGNSRGWGESGDGTINGITTNMHITSSSVDGPVPKELCIIPTLREHDFGGQLNRGHLTGPFPHWLANCYPKLEELDLSNNRLTGTLPAYLATMPLISEIKFENNGLIGTIPPELGNIARLRRFQAEFNNMRGPIPTTFKNANPYLTQFHIARNDFEGDLSMLAGGHLTTATVHDNPKLCGMVPASVRFAKGYNPGGTGLGKPCHGTAGAPAAPAAPPAAAAAAPTGSPSVAADTGAGNVGGATTQGAGAGGVGAVGAGSQPAADATNGTGAGTGAAAGNAAIAPTVGPASVPTAEGAGATGGDVAVTPTGVGPVRANAPSAEGDDNAVITPTGVVSANAPAAEGPGATGGNTGAAVPTIDVPQASAPAAEGANTADTLQSVGGR